MAVDAILNKVNSVDANDLLRQQALNLDLKINGTSNVESWDAGVIQQDGNLFQEALNGAAEKVSPADGIVNSIQGVRDQFLKIQHNLEALAQKGQDFSSADLFQMQYDVMQLSYINEISSKTADKTSQGAQTLFRNQG